MTNRTCKEVHNSHPALSQPAETRESNQPISRGGKEASRNLTPSSRPSLPTVPMVWGKRAHSWLTQCPECERINPIKPTMNLAFCSCGSVYWGVL